MKIKVLRINKNETKITFNVSALRSEDETVLLGDSLGFGAAPVFAEVGLSVELVVVVVFDVVVFEIPLVKLLAVAGLGRAAVALVALGTVGLEEKYLLNFVQKNFKLKNRRL